jgi:hypothetical protein
VGVVVWRDDRCETTVEGNDGGGWSFDGMVLWLGGSKIKTRLSSAETGKC